MKTSHLAILIGLIAVASGATYTVTPSSDWQTRLKTLSAGDTLTFSAGTYTSTSKLGVSFPGTSSAPILIQGASGANVTLTRGDANQNLIDIQSGSYFTIQNIRFRGGSKGVRFGETGNINNAVFQNNVVFNTATTAISCNDGGRVYNNVKFIGNEVYNTGSQESECFYMGCSDNNCRATNCIVEKNFCHDTTSATSGSLGSGIQIKTGSYNNIVRNNVVVDVKGAGVLIYDDYDQGVNSVYGNFIWRTGDNGIQATAGARIYNNIVALPTGNGIQIQANQLQSGKQLRNIVIDHNTIYSTSGNRGISVGSTTSGSTFTVLNNAVFVTGTALALPSGATSSSNFVTGSATTELQNPTSTSSPNYYPKSTSSLINAGDANAKTLVPMDFNCYNRNHTRPTIGAYEYFGTTNPGPALSKAFKRGIC